MSLPSHHPADDHLFSYASGRMGEVKAVLVATHLAYCPVCRARVAAFEAQCGDWFEELAPSPELLGSLDDMLSKLDAQLDALERDAPAAAAADAVRKPPPSVPVAPPGHPLVPLPLRDWSGFRIDTADWNPLAQGVALSQWSVEKGGSSVCLLRMGPGAAVPAHRHTAEELLLVLQGSFSDEYGRYRVDDVATYAAWSDHHATGDPGAGDCICLFLLDGELQFLD